MLVDKALYLVAIDDRHLQIEEHQTETLLPQFANRFGTTSCQFDLITVDPQQRLQALTQRLLVVNNQDSRTFDSVGIQNFIS